MSGILDSKARIIDVKLSAVGQEQLSNLKFDPAYITFSDKNTFYQQSSISSSYDSAVDRLFFEASNYNFDKLTYDVDDSNNIIFDTQQVINVSGTYYSLSGKSILTATSSITNKDTNFASVVETLSNRFLSNFQNLQILKTKNSDLDTSAFELSQNEIKISLDTTKITKSTDINALTPIFADSQFSNVSNFQFLQPYYVNKKNKKKYLHQFTDVRQTFVTSSNSAQESFTKVNVLHPKDSNDICVQAFEVRNDGLTKLHAFIADESYQESTKSFITTVYCGNIYENSYGLFAFNKILTMQIESFDEVEQDV